MPDPSTLDGDGDEDVVSGLGHRLQASSVAEYPRADLHLASWSRSRKAEARSIIIESDPNLKPTPSTAEADTERLPIRR